MKIRIPTNTDINGNALCIKACYFKNAALSTLTSWMFGSGSHYPVTGVLELLEDE